MATVHSILVNLAANTARFNSNMKGARSQVSMFSRAVSAAKALVVPALGSIGAAFAVHKLAEWVGQSIQTADAAWKMSGALGMSTQSLMALQSAAGRMANLEGDAFNTSLNKMVQNLGDAAMAGGPVADTLSRLGLSAAALAAQSPDQAFLSIADAIQKIENPAQRTAALVDIFGKAGAKLGPMFTEGAAGIRKAMEQAKAWGVALNEVDAAKLAIAREQLEELGARFEGIKNQLAIAVIPYVSAFLDELLKIMPAADTIRDAFMVAFRTIGSVVGVVAEMFQSWFLLVQGGAYLIIKAMQGIMTAVRAVGEGLVWIINNTGGEASMPAWITSSEDFLEQKRKDMAAWIGEVARMKPGEAVTDFMAKVENAANNAANALKKPRMEKGITDQFQQARTKIEGILSGITQDIATFGMTESEKKIFDLSQMMGVTPEDILRARATLERLQELKDQADLSKQGEELTKSLASPFEKYQEAITTADKLLAAGAINAETYARAVAKAGEDVLSGNNEQASAALVTRRIDFRLAADTRKPDKQAQLIALQKAHLAETKKQTAAIESMADSTGGYDVVLQAG